MKEVTQHVDQVISSVVTIAVTWTIQLCDYSDTRQTARTSVSISMYLFFYFFFTLLSILLL